MAQVKEKINRVCPRCGGSEVYTVTENVGLGIRKTRYTACFSVTNTGEVCWYHLPDMNRQPKKEKCSRPGCNHPAIERRSICKYHYNLLSLERYHRDKTKRKRKKRKV